MDGRGGIDDLIRTGADDMEVSFILKKKEYIRLSVNGKESAVCS